jgi:rubrerythrin
MKKRNDKEIAREGIASEIEAINLYEEMSKETNDKRVKKVLLDIAKEEKTHLGEFSAVLMREDTAQRKEIEAGRKEVKDIESADAFSKKKKKAKK